MYVLSPPRAGSWALGVEATLALAPVDRLVLPESDGALTEVDLVEGDRVEALARDRDGWLAPECRRSCRLRFTLDLGAVAERCHGRSCPRRVGEAILANADVWMLRPDTNADAAVHVDVRGGDPARFATGLRKDPAGGYALRGDELSEASYTAFGDFRRSRVDVPGGPLDLVLLGAPLDMGDAALTTWVKGAAGCIAGLYGRFPVAATLFVVPIPGADEVVFGRVMSLSGGSVVLLFGADTKAASSREDWVVVHELSHLGTVSFVGEGHWLEEGLATYYEPILRERAGWMTEADLWRHFAEEMPRGVHKDGEPPDLEDRDDIDSTYWGGALFAMLADLEIRKASGGKRSLDDVLRASLQELGDATRQAKVLDFIRVGDQAAGSSALSGVYERVALHGGAVDLRALWEALGVVKHPDGTVTLRDDAPLASTRKALAAGSPHPEHGYRPGGCPSIAGVAARGPPGAPPAGSTGGAARELRSRIAATLARTALPLRGRAESGASTDRRRPPRSTPSSRRRAPAAARTHSFPPSAGRAGSPSGGGARGALRAPRPHSPPDPRGSPRSISVARSTSTPRRRGARREASARSRSSWAWRPGTTGRRPRRRAAFFVRSPREEAPMLERGMRARLAEASLLVTFNGKSFDMPLLRARFVMARMEPPPEPPHLDLLHVRLRRPSSAARSASSRGAGCGRSSGTCSASSGWTACCRPRSLEHVPAPTEDGRSAAAARCRRAQRVGRGDDGVSRRPLRRGPHRVPARGLSLARRSRRRRDDPAPRGCPRPGASRGALGGGGPGSGARLPLRARAEIAKAPGTARGRSPTQSPRRRRGRPPRAAQAGQAPTSTG